MDLLGRIIRTSPEFRGKRRLVDRWMVKSTKDKRIRELPGGAEVLCDLSIPYEGMVWLKREEQHDLELLGRLLKRGHTFVDCGANIGIWSLVAASIVGSSGKVYAFEPNPFTFEKLSYNVSINGGAVHLSNSAVGNVTTSLPFGCSRYHNVSHMGSNENGESILVPVVTLDSFLANEPVNGVKIDVEGFEFEVLKGSENLLKLHKPWLCVEFNTVLNKVTALKDWPAHEYLGALGYKCRLFNDALATSKAALPDSWQTAGYCNLYYFPK